MKKTVLIIGAAALLAACDSGESKTDKDATDAVGMANPASVYCVEVKEGKSVIRTNEGGGQVGICILPDGTEIEEWELYRKENPGNEPAEDGDE